MSVFVRSPWTGKLVYSFYTIYTNGLSGFEQMMHTYPFKRGVMKDMALKAREDAGDLPLYYTEWNSAYENDFDEPRVAVLTAKTIFDLDGIADIYAYWTFSDLFEESQQSSVPFHHGMGLQTIHGIPKPTYRMFEMLHRMGKTRLPVKYDAESTVEMAATKSGDRLGWRIYAAINDSGTRLGSDYDRPLKSFLKESTNANFEYPPNQRKRYVNGLRIGSLV
jgi:Glycosyl hydrolases family 39